MDNREAAESGDRRQALEVLRDTLADQLDTTDKHIHAQLAAQYRATLKELETLGGQKGSKADELRARREARHRNADGTAPAARRSQPRRSGRGDRVG